MRKNSVDRKGVNGVKVIYKINGLNLDRFINVAKKRGIQLFDIKKEGNKQLYVAVSYKDCQKFFAIAKELCYNIKRIKYSGKGYPFFLLLNSIWSLVGALIFVLIAFLASDTVFSLSFSGSGSVYKEQVQSYLASHGVKPFVRFSSLDLEGLEDGILADNPHLSFVSVTKHGSKLNLELILSTDNVEKLEGNVSRLIATENGQIEQIKVYRGTAQFSVGDYVKEGDVIIDGYAVIKEQVVETNVIAFVTLKASRTINYFSNDQNDEQNAKLFALAQMGEKQVVSVEVQKEKIDKTYIYNTTVYYRMVIYAG